MKYICKKDLEKVMDFIQDKAKLTVESQVKLKEFMDENSISYTYTPCINKQNIKILAKMKLTSRNPKDAPNWARTLSDGSQIVWNRKHLQFYHLESHGITTYDYDDWRSIFPDTIWDEDLEWLVDNMGSYRFAYIQTTLINILSGTYKQYYFL